MEQDNLKPTLNGHFPLDYITLMGELPIPGVSKVAAPLSKILSFILPSEKSAVEKKLDEALVLLNNAYSLMEKALSEKAFEIFTTQIDGRIDSIVDSLESCEDLVPKSSVSSLTDDCKQILLNAESAIVQAGDLLKNFEASTQNSSGEMVQYIGDYSRIVLSCYQAITLSNYGFTMVTTALEPQRTEYTIEIKTIDAHKNSLFDRYQTFIKTKVPACYPKWCKGFFTQQYVAFKNYASNKKLLFLPNNDIGFGYNTALFYSELKSIKDEGGAFLVLLAENEGVDVNDGARWNMFALKKEEKIPLFVVTFNQGKEFAKRIYSRYTVDSQTEVVHDFGISYDKKQRILIKPLQKDQNWNLKGEGDFVTSLVKEDSDKTAWVCSTLE